MLDRLGLRSDPAAGAGPVGTVLMAGAGATLLAQWGLIPNLGLGPRTSLLAGMGLASMGTICFAFAFDLHTIALGFAIASMGFGLFRPGFTSGASLAVSRAEQGQVGGIVASLNGAAYIFAPALGVWLYNHHEAVAFSVIGGLCAGVVGWGWRALDSDRAMESPRG